MSARRLLPDVGMRLLGSLRPEDRTGVLAVLLAVGALTGDVRGMPVRAPVGFLRLAAWNCVAKQKKGSRAATAGSVL